MNKPLIITKKLRQDYDQYMLGQKKQVDIAKERRMTTSQVTRAFDFLFHEVRYKQLTYSAQ